MAFRFPLVEALRAQDLDEPSELIHGFHAYPARMHPAVARVLLRELSVGPGSEVLDPFCGSGTVAVEALISGWRALGSDLDPLALRLARVKTERRGPKTRARFLDRLAAIGAASSARVRDRDDVQAKISADERRWYEVHVLKELAGLLEEIRKVDDERDRLALEMVFSAIVVKFSRQRSETAARTTDKRLRKGLVTEFFVRKGEELAAAWAELSAAIPRPHHLPRFVLSDARRLPRTLAGEYRCDLVLTSPPYGGTYDYLHHHARRHAWLGISPKKLREKEIGARRYLSRGNGGAGSRARWDDEMTAVLGSIAELLRPDAVAVLLVGDAELGGERIAADSQLERLAPAAELEFLAAASQPRPDWRGGPPRREHLVALRRVDFAGPRG
ncbi:putative modification methylase [Enhygromyxa salina]|uniref:site-specific DNA-methyltransferase (cytosine-N(4)-specific) n=1 Tax=Enhygromyxa salina TaxID=215803 RepID=A0A0C2D6M0_9BACT|nr:DNA methyltransferase [Enhygromyxa salina]KIG18816.1 putative modification methylase [Enhygromyxa salina]